MKKHTPEERAEMVKHFRDKAKRLIGSATLIDADTFPETHRQRIRDAEGYNAAADALELVPKLLEALKQIVHTQAKPNTEEHSVAIHDALAAIRAAEGEG